MLFQSWTICCWGDFLSKRCSGTSHCNAFLKQSPHKNKQKKLIWTDVNSLINTYLHFCPSDTPNISEMWDLVTFWCPCSWIVRLGLFTLNQGRDLVRMPCIFLTMFCNLCFLFCLSTKKCWILQHTNIFLCGATSAEQNERFPSEFSVQWRSSCDLLSQSLIPWLPAVWNVFRRLTENTVQLHQVSSVEYFGMFPCLTNEHVLLHASKKFSNKKLWFFLLEPTSMGPCFQNFQCNGDN